MKLQTKAIEVAQRTSYLLQAGKSGRKPQPALHPPAWFKVITAHPPTANLIQKPINLKMYQDKGSVGKSLGKRRRDFFETHVKPKHSTSGRHLYKVQTIKYFEDQIRALFFKQHPWELARPKLLIENDGNDASKYNWKSIDQPLKALDGESVVQRTLYILDSPEFRASRWTAEFEKTLNSKSKSYCESQFRSRFWTEAYDQARLEFYRLRIREEAQVQVANEEALMYGSVFYKSHTEYGIDNEAKHIKQWSIDAIKSTKEKRAKFAAGGPQLVAEEPEVPGSAETEVLKEE